MPARGNAVCAYELALQEVEAEYSIANGREHDAEVIYGDTDSVMIRFGPKDLETVMALGKCPFIVCAERTS